MLIQLIEGVYRLLWGDLLTLHLGNKPGTKEPPRSDKQALCQSDTIAVFMLLSWHPCPLRRFAPALPKGEPFHTVRQQKAPPFGGA